MVISFQRATRRQSRAERAIADRLLATDALLKSHRETLRLTRQCLYLQAN